MEKEFQDMISKNKGILYKIGRSYTTEEADFEDLYQEMLTGPSGCPPYTD